ncbi:putative glutathione-specific gamma-glutamylcyclotransferase 2 isoform X2 [Apostichopus japonicus]|uniref:putative glutathione-specific gamma-glutamylcyclotransferase 2 isoform X2 n=1 Tax=Stichopus japonicus TaxID=307972 RepID=UPI003AB6166D
MQSNKAVLDLPIQMWVFGYGSLIWKVDFPYQQKFAGYIEGYCRRFWQGSTDHRGFPEKPGRVVTLIESPKEIVWGVAYQIANDNVESVLDHLDFREKNGYSKAVVAFHPSDSSVSPFNCLVYMANPQNPEYLGPAPLNEMALQIRESVGPSGANAEYLLQLATAIKTLFPDVRDDHLFKLEEAVKNLNTTD